MLYIRHEPFYMSFFRAAYRVAPNCPNLNFIGVCALNIISRFFPNRYVDSVYHLPLDEFKKNNITALLFDIDNTLAPYDVACADEKLIAHFAALTKMGFKLCALSNNKEKRVSVFCASLSIPYVYSAGKPRLGGITAAIKKLETPNEHVAMIGDQVFTDVWCGNRKGLFTVLVKPVSVKDEWVTKIKRGIERQVIARYLKSGVGK